jgi:3-dehydroquinate synthase
MSSMSSQQSALPENSPRDGDVETAYWQRFAVAYEFPVVFTRGLFRPQNRTLADSVARLEPERRHRCLAFMDEGLSGLGLGSKIEA